MECYNVLAEPFGGRLVGEYSCSRGESGTAWAIDALGITWLERGLMPPIFTRDFLSMILKVIEVQGSSGSAWERCSTIACLHQ